MNIVMLRTFLAVVESGNLNKAAERLNVTQSTVSARLDALDEALGQALLVRSRKGARITKAGFALLRHAEIIVAAWDRARRAVDIPAPYVSTASLSCEHGLWTRDAEAWVEGVLDDHPDLALEIWPGTPEESARWLSSGLVDAAITRVPVSGSGVAHRRLSSSPVLLVGTPTAANARGGFTAVDLGPEQRRRSATETEVPAPARVTFGTGADHWALDHLLRTGGSAALPEPLVRPLIEAGALERLEDTPRHAIDSHLCWREESAATHPWLAPGSG